MDNEDKPLAGNSSYTIEDFDEESDPNNVKIKTPKQIRGSFTILPNDNHIEENLDQNLEDSFKDKEHSISNYEECMETNNESDIIPGGLKESYNLDQIDEPEIKNPNSSYVIKDRSYDQNDHYNDDDEVTEFQDRTVANRSSSSNNNEQNIDTNYSDDFDKEGPRHSVLDNRQALLDPIRQENADLVNKSFTVFDSQTPEKPVDSPGNSQEYNNNIQIANNSQLNASFSMEDSGRTFPRPIANRNENRLLSDSYTIPDTSEKNKNLLKENARLQKQIEELNLCIKEYGKFLELSLQNKQKSEGSNNVSITNLLSERDQALEEAANIGKAYSDLQKRLENSKELLKNYKENEIKLTKSIKDMEEWSEKQMRRYDTLKKLAEEKITSLNEKMIQEKKAHHDEMERLQTTMKYQEHRIRNLESELKQKIENNDELTQMCELLIKRTEEASK